MKIVFLCSSLEAGRDGVGDYTRLLAEECLRQGGQCSIIAVHDRHAREWVESEFVTGAGSIPFMRMPATLPWPERAQKGKKFREKFQPDWISLQFVPYGFDDKGVVWNLDRCLPTIIGGCRLQIMFHETWIGASAGASLKEKLVGRVQRYFIRRMVRSLQPRCAHTNARAYLEMLARAGISAQWLPLFGHIPIDIEPDDAWLIDALREHGLDINAKNKSGFWFFGLFGALHSVWPAEPLFSYLREAGAKHGRKITIIAIGRMGASGEQLWASLALRYSSEFIFCKLGERTPGQISQFFQFVDFGLATTPWALAGKSGTVAAMLESGLPVIVNRDDWRFPFGTQESPHSPLLCKMEADLASRLTTLKRQPASSTLPDIAHQFLNSLDSKLS